MTSQEPLIFKPVHNDEIKPVAPAIGTGGSTTFFMFTVAIPDMPTLAPKVAAAAR